MHQNSRHQFWGSKLPLIIAVFAVAFQLILLVLNWYYKEEPIRINLSTLITFAINYANMLFVSLLIFKSVLFLNTKVSWSFPSSIFRAVIDIVLFSFITIGWIILVNFILFDLARDVSLSIKQVLLFVALGTIINLFLVPLIEFVVLMNKQKETELISQELQLENTKFKYEILKNQINPHFLFNSLGVLNSLITTSPQKSKSYLNRFSNVLRHVLDFREYNSIALEDEAKFLADYIYLLNIRFENTFEARVDLPPRFAQRQILPMVLQLLIENVIKHNKMSESQPIIVHIQAREDGIEVWNKIRLKSSISSWGAWPG